MATNSLPQSTLDTFQPISRSTICILARLAAKRIVTEQLRDAGVRVTLVRPAAINEQANAYLVAHPELYDQARERAVRLNETLNKRTTQKPAEIAGFSFTNIMHELGAGNDDDWICKGEYRWPDVASSD